MPSYLTPGVYVEEVSSGARPIEAVGTSTAGFVGKAPNAKARLNEAVAVNNWTEFTKIFCTVGAKERVGVINTVGVQIGNRRGEPVECLAHDELAHEEHLSKQRLTDDEGGKGIKDHGRGAAKSTGGKAPANVDGDVGARLLKGVTKPEDVKGEVGDACLVSLVNATPCGEPLGHPDACGRDELIQERVTERGSEVQVDAIVGVAAVKAKLGVILSLVLQGRKRPLANACAKRGADCPGFARRRRERLTCGQRFLCVDLLVTVLVDDLHDLLSGLKFAVGVWAIIRGLLLGFLLSLRVTLFGSILTSHGKAWGAKEERGEQRCDSMMIEHGLALLYAISLPSSLCQCAPHGGARSPGVPCFLSATSKIVQVMVHLRPHQVVLKTLQACRTTHLDGAMVRDVVNVMRRPTT